jgi:hypothetical protein
VKAAIGFAANNQMPVVVLVKFYPDHSLRSNDCLTDWKND